MADDDKRWKDMTPEEQAALIRQISGAVNGLQFRVQDLEEAVKDLQERLKPDGRASAGQRRAITRRLQRMQPRCADRASHSLVRIERKNVTTVVTFAALAGC